MNLTIKEEIQNKIKERATELGMPVEELVEKLLNHTQFFLPPKGEHTEGVK
jgi:hypothetical protein